MAAALGVELPAVMPAVLAAFAFAFASAAGDLNVPLVLGQGGFETLPVYLYRLTSSYRFPEACAAGVVDTTIASALRRTHSAAMAEYCSARPFAER